MDQVVIAPQHRQLPKRRSAAVAGDAAVDPRKRCAELSGVSTDSVCWKVDAATQAHEIAAFDPPPDRVPPEPVT